MLIDTVLGSCVSVCLYDTETKIGGMNHFMLPFWNGDGLASPKFGNIATEKLIEKLISQGAKRDYLIAKLFGGANQIKGISDVGLRNIEIARKILRDQGVDVVAESVGGEVGRKILFNTGTGEVFMKFLKNKLR